MRQKGQHQTAGAGQHRTLDRTGLPFYDVLRNGEGKGQEFMKCGSRFGVEAHGFEKPPESSRPVRIPVPTLTML